MTFLLWIAFAFGNQLPWYYENNVSSVSLSSPEGGVPDGELFPLLETEVGALLTPLLIRSDVITLMQVGAFSSVEVDVKPSVMFPDYVDVVFRIYPAPVLKNLEIDVENRELKQYLLSNSQLQIGQVFMGGTEIERLRSRIERLCSSDGWYYSSVEIESEMDANNLLQLRISILDLKTKSIGNVQTLNVPIRLERQFKWILRRHGIQKNKRLILRQLERGRDELRNLLFSKGYVQARVQFALVEDLKGEYLVSLIVEPGQLIEIQTEGFRISKAKTYSILGIYPGDRVTENDLPKFKEHLLRHMASLGYAEAVVGLEINETDILTHLNINIEPKDRWLVHEVIVGEDTQIEPFAIKRMMAPKQIIFQRRIYDEKTIEEGAKTIEEYYHGLGFIGSEVILLEPKVTKDETLWQSFKEVQLKLEINEVAPVPMTPIEVFGLPEGETEFPSPPDIGYFAPKIISDYESFVHNHLQSEGYWNSSVEREYFTLEDGSYRVVFTLSPGEKTRLRSIIIEGEGRTKQNIIRERVPVNIGEPILPKDISLVREQLYDLDIFQAVQVELVGSQENIKDLKIKVHEKPNWILETGGRVSTDQGVQATLLMGPRNIAGNASRIHFNGQAGYGWEEEGWGLDIDQLVWRTSLRYTAPSLLNVNHDVFSDIILREILQESYYRFRQSGGSVGIESRLNPQTESIFEYRVRYMAVEDIDAGSLVEQDPWISSFQSSNRTIDGYPKRWWSGLQMTLFWDNRGNSLNPTHGQWVRSQVAIGDGLLNELPAVRTVIDANSLWDLNVIRYLFRVYGGVGYSPKSKTLGFDERFSLGGASSLRGFSRNRVGPANQSLRTQIDFPDYIQPSINDIALRKEPTLWVPTGGDYMMMLSQELHFPLERFGYDSSSWIVFMDAGRVSFLSNDIMTDSINLSLDPIIRYSMGTGMRYSTAIGPLAVDIAVNPNPIKLKEERYLYFHGSLGAF